MTDEFPLSKVFVVQASRERGWRVGPALEALLQHLCQEGRAAWPAIDILDVDFVGHLGALLREAGGEDPVVLLRDLRAADLYLACGCAAGLPAALQAFDQEHLRRVPAFVHHIDSSAAFADEVRQGLRDRLLVADSGKPRIASYSGQGPLSSWVRISATRLAYNLIRARGPMQATEGTDFLDRLQGPDDPELNYLKQRYARELKEALSEAFAALAPEQRGVLNLYTMDGLTTTELGRLYRVNHSTVSRWLKQAREVILAETQRRLRERLNLGESSMESLVRLVISQVDASLPRLLADGAEELAPGEEGGGVQ